jgi:hypothetical protein
MKDERKEDIDPRDSLLLTNFNIIFKDIFNKTSDLYLTTLIIFNDIFKDTQ